MWPIFHGLVTLSYISKTIWCMNVIFSDNEKVWPKLWPQSKYKSTWPIFHGLVILLNIQDYLMDEHYSWYNGSVWHIDWPYQVYVGQWPIFYGPAVLLHILKIIWWRNVVLGMMDQCDSKIDLVKYIWGQWPIFHGPLILPYIIVRLKLFLYIKKWHRSGVFVPLRDLALVCHFFLTDFWASMRASLQILYTPWEWPCLCRKKNQDAENYFSISPSLQCNT